MRRQLVGVLALALVFSLNPLSRNASAAVPTGCPDTWGMKWTAVADESDAQWRGLIDKWTYIRMVDSTGAYDSFYRAWPTEIQYEVRYRWKIDGLPWSELSGIRSTWRNFGATRLSPKEFNYYGAVAGASREAEITVRRAGCQAFTQTVVDRLVDVGTIKPTTEEIPAFVERNYVGQVPFTARDFLKTRFETDLSRLRLLVSAGKYKTGEVIASDGVALFGNSSGFLYSYFPSWETIGCAQRKADDNDQVSLVLIKLPCVIKVVGITTSRFRGGSELSPVLDSSFSMIEFGSFSLTGSFSQTTKAKATTIFCRKGKVTKKVSGSPPKCPTGFKNLGLRQ